MVFLSLVLLVFVTLAFVRETGARSLLREQQQIVAELKGDLLHEYEGEGFVGLAYEVDRRSTARLDANAVYLLTGRKGNIVAGNLAQWPRGLDAPRDWAELEIATDWGKDEQLVGVSTIILPNGGRLLTGHVLVARARAERSMREGLLLALPAGLILSLMITLFTVALISRKLASVAAVTDAVRSGNLSLRIPEPRGSDVFDRLAQRINAMLDQQEQLVGQLRMMTDGLAHDLRSPITRLKSSVEHAIVEAHDEASINALEGVSAEADTLLAMLTTALQISRAEAGIGRENFSATDLAAMLDDIAEIYGPLGEDHGIAITREGTQQMFARVHRQLLSQAIGNLIDNALKYANGADQISLSLASEEDSIRISVADNGVGIPTDRLQQARRRFGRLDPERGVTGAGLGLSLVEAVAALHAGKLELADNAPGLKAVIWLEKSARE